MDRIAYFLFISVRVVLECHGYGADTWHADMRNTKKVFKVLTSVAFIKIITGDAACLP